MTRLIPVHYRDLCRVFEKDGFRQVRNEGDPLAFVKEGCLRPVAIPAWREVPVFIKNNLRTAGMSRERHVELLNG